MEAKDSPDLKRGHDSSILAVFRTALAEIWYGTKGPFLSNRQGVSGICLVCKHGDHVTGIPKADWPGVKNKQLIATPC